MNEAPAPLHVGWATADLTPDQPVVIVGQFHLRISEGVRDPITATVLVLDDGATRVAMVSCDLVCIADDLRQQVRTLTAQRVPELTGIIMNATHTHTSVATRALIGETLAAMPLPLGAMPVAEYVSWAADRIATAIERAWSTRAAGQLAWGLTHAVVGQNRRWANADGESRMYGNTNDPAFSHIEGYEDHAVNVIATWDLQGALTGLLLNVACPSQVSENEFTLSADYWHETREELRGVLGSELPVLAQCSAAGDQSPHHIVRKRAEARMETLRALNRRQEIARRLTAAVIELLPVIKPAAEANPRLQFLQRDLRLSRRLLTAEEVAESLAEAVPYRQRFEELDAEFRAHPERAEEPRWYIEISRNHRRACWYESVAARYEAQQNEPRQRVEISLLRIGDMAIATNPFEYYLDFGMHIKARSPAVQTFVVQLAGEGTYVAPCRSLSGGGYGAVPASTWVGPEGGWELAHQTVELLQQLWDAPVPQPVS